MNRTYLLLLILITASCNKEEQPTEQQLADHRNDVEAWSTHRIDELKSHDGWLNLAGLFWLNEGINSFGSGEGNAIVFPLDKIAANAGYFMVKGSTVTLTPAPGSDITIYGSPVVKETVVFHPDSVKAIKLLQGSITKHGSLEWYIIRRDDKMGIRLRDMESDGVKNFRGIERYPIDYNWKVEAKFEPAPTGATIDITNVLGQTTSQDLTGTYVFNVEGNECRLSATGTGQKLFIVFADNTNGKETYPAGKFIYVDRPDSTGRAFIDFNKSYNPPCAFTDFATCPLPPKQNVLAVAITAGEKNYELHKL